MAEMHFAFCGCEKVEIMFWLCDFLLKMLRKCSYSSYYCNWGNRELLKYFRIVCCVITNHSKDQDM